MNKSKKMSKIIYAISIDPILETRGEWDARLSEESDPEISFVFHPNQPQANEDGGTTWAASPFRHEEGFELRESFFAIRTAEDALNFYRRYGPHQVMKPLDTVAKPLRFSAVVRIRKFYMHALFERSIDNMRRKYSGEGLHEGTENIYLWQNLYTELLFRQPAAAVVRCKDVEDALRATVFLDRLRGMPWKLCAREDCGKPFEQSSKRTKLYCSTDCAHLQSVRDYNERKRKVTAKTTKPSLKKGKG